MTDVNLQPLDGLKLCEQILKMTQKPEQDTIDKCPVCHRGTAARCLTHSHYFAKIKTDEAFQAVFQLVECLWSSGSVEQPSLPQKVLRWIDNGACRGYFSETVKEYYCLPYFEAINQAVAFIKDRFDQRDYAMYRNLEEVLLKGAAGSDLREPLREASGVYHVSRVYLQSLSLATKTTSVNCARG